MESPAARFARSKRSSVVSVVKFGQIRYTVTKSIDPDTELTERQETERSKKPFKYIPKFSLPKLPKSPAVVSDISMPETF
jgi:hypothetical protein